MAKASRQIGSKVTSSRGRVLARVEGVLMDPEERRIRALVVRSLVPLSRPRLLPLEYIRVWSPSGPALSVEKLPPLRQVQASLHGVVERLGDPLGLPVTVGEERRLGTVCDIGFDGADGTLTSVEVSRGAVGDLTTGAVEVAAVDIARIGPEGVVARLDSRAAETTMERVAGVVGKKVGRAAAKAKHVVKRALEDLKKGDD